ANGDDVCLEASETAIRYGLDQAAVTLNSLQVAASYTGEIGLPRRNTSGASGYVEYRPRYLQIGAAAVVIGHGEGDGSGRLLLDTGSVQTEIVVHRTAAPAEQQGHAFAWKGTHAGNALDVRASPVG